MFVTLLITQEVQLNFQETASSRNDNVGSYDFKWVMYRVNGQNPMSVFDCNFGEWIWMKGCDRLYITMHTLSINVSKFT